MEDNDLRLVREMLSRDPELIEPADWTPPPLHCSVLWNRPDVATLFLEAGANIERLDPDRQTTPMRYAIMYCKLEMIQLLHSHGANTGPIRSGGSNAYELALAGLRGDYEEFDDLPRRDAYEPVIRQLEQLGVANQT
ncbi:MAG: ankyrin repeat domain-containing protein [Planctomycetota bacterium]